ncbi:hypothetical protein [Streptomyces sp. NPDC050485]|uniref:hypothetical protein n=1 Tax=Streptomyces sp. NPDC050485 TaxID=3365617 RepID=UPI00378B7E9E
MNDPALPPSSEPFHPTGAMYETAVEAVEAVVTWYSRLILAERRSTAPDTERLEQLTEHQRACREDRKKLENAGEQELARITTTYEALLEKLEAAEQ